MTENESCSRRKIDGRVSKNTGRVSILRSLWRTQTKEKQKLEDGLRLCRWSAVFCRERGRGSKNQSVDWACSSVDRMIA